MVQAYDPKTKPKNADTTSQERVDSQAALSQVQKKTGSKSKNRAIAAQSQQQVQMRLKSREAMRSKSPNQYESQQQDNLNDLISEVQGNYIKIGHVLGNVNIIHQQNSQRNLHQNEDSQNTGAQRGNQDDDNFNPYDQRQTRAGDTGVINTTQINSKIGTKSSHKNIQSNQDENSSRSRSRGSGLTMTKKNLKNFNTSLVNSNQGKRISDLQNVYNVTNTTNKTYSNNGQEVNVGGLTMANMKNFDQMTKQEGQLKFISDYKADKVPVVENNPTDILENLENGFAQIDVEHHQQFDSIRNSEGNPSTMTVNQQPQPTKTNNKVKSTALTSKQKKKKKSGPNTKSVNNQQQQFIVNQKESKTIQDRQLKAKNLMYQTQKQESLNQFNPVQSEENLQGYELANLRANGNLRQNHGIYDQVRTPNTSNGYGDMYRISSTGIQPNRMSNKLNQDSVNQSQIWDQKKTSIASQYGIQKTSFQKKDQEQIMSGSIQTNFTKFDSKDEISSAERTFGSQAFAGLGGLPVIQNKKNSVFVHNTAGGDAISPSQNRKSRLGRKLINNIARNKNNRSIGSNGDNQIISNRYDQLAKNKFVSKMPDQIQEDLDKLNDQRLMQNISINRGNDSSLKRTRPRTKQIGSNNPISQAQTSQYKYRAYKLVPVTQASLAQPIKDQRQKKNVSSSALDIRHKTPGAQSISIGNTGRVQKFQRMKQSESPNNSMIVRAANNSVQNKQNKNFNEINLDMTETEGDLINYSQIPSEQRNIPEIDIQIGPLKGTQQVPYIMDVLEGDKVKSSNRTLKKGQIDTQEFNITTNIKKLNDYTDQNLDTMEKIDALEHQQNMNLYTQSDYPHAYQNIEVQQQSEHNLAPLKNNTETNWNQNPGLMIVQQENLENAEPNQSSFVSNHQNDKEDSINNYDMNYDPNFDESFKSNDGKLRFSVENKVRKIRTKQHNSRAQSKLEEAVSNNPQRHGLLKPIRDSQNQWPYGGNLTNSQKQLTTKGVAQITKIQNSYFSNGDNKTSFQRKRDARLNELLQSKQQRENQSNFNNQLADQVNYQVDKKAINTANNTQRQQFLINQKKQQTTQPSPKHSKQKTKSIQRKTDRAQLSNSLNNSLLINHNKLGAKNNHSTQRQPNQMANINYDSARSPSYVKVVQNQGHQIYSSQQNDSSFTHESQDRIININLHEQQKQMAVGAEFVAASTLSSRKAKVMSRDTDRSGSMQRQHQRYDTQRNRSLVKEDKQVKTKAAKIINNQIKTQTVPTQTTERPNTKILGQQKKENQWNTLIAQENQKKMSKAKERRVVERLTQDQKWKQKVEENNKIQQEIEQITSKIQARKNQDFRIKMQKKLEKYHNKLEKEYQKQNITFKKDHKGSISPIRSQALKRAASPKRAESSLQKPYEATLNDEQNKLQSDKYEILSNYQVVQGYEARFGKADKFIRANSPIDKYYRMYVIEPESKVYGQSQRGGSRLSNQHLHGCPHANHNSKSSFGKGMIPLPSPQRQKKATQLLENAKNVDELFMIADTNQDAKSVLQQTQLVCNCHKMGNEMITQRLSVRPSDVRSAAGSHGVFAGDTMSAHGLDFETNFRKFRSPCRKTCSTIHNPLYHCSRFGIKLSDCRPASANQNGNKQAEMMAIDWLKTEINEAVRMEEAKEKEQRDLSHEQEIGNGYQTERDQSPDDLMGGVHTERDRSATKVQRQMEDMKNILKQIESTAQKEKAKGTLTEKEVLHYNTIMKDPALKEQLTETERGDLLTKCWKTLDFVMSSLILSKDFELLKESNEKKQENAKQQLGSKKIGQKEFEGIEDEFIIKALIRCEKMFDAKQEIVRILVKIKKREELMNQFEDEVDKCTETRAKGYYFIILKLSTRIHNQIERLRVDNPLLNRPFIFNRENFQSALVKQQLFLRDSLIKTYRHLKRDLDRVLDKSGKIIKVKVLADYNQQVKKLEDADRYENLSVDQKREITSQLNKGHIGKLRRGTALSQMGLQDQNQSERNMSDID